MLFNCARYAFFFLRVFFFSTHLRCLAYCQFDCLKVVERRRAAHWSLCSFRALIGYEYLFCLWRVGIAIAPSWKLPPPRRGFCFFLREKVAFFFIEKERTQNTKNLFFLGKLLIETRDVGSRPLSVTTWLREAAPSRTIRLRRQSPILWPRLCLRNRALACVASIHDQSGLPPSTGVLGSHTSKHWLYLFTSKYGQLLKKTRLLLSILRFVFCQRYVGKANSGGNSTPQVAAGQELFSIPTSFTRAFP